MENIVPHIQGQGRLGNAGDDFKSGRISACVEAITNHERHEIVGDVSLR